MECAFKVSIVGCGAVGATAAYALLLAGIPTDLTLIDADKRRAEGLMFDLEHSLSFTSFVKLEHSDEMAAVNGSHLVVITAGRKQQSGETRLDLIKGNREIYSSIIPQIARSAPNAILLIVSNPVDAMTYEAIRLSGFPQQRVFGSGTALDTARFQFHISEKLKINPHSIDAYVLGEHGDSSFPVLSSANVTGKPLLSFKECTRADALECYEKARTAAYRIINDLGFTCYSIATTIREIARAIFHDTREVFMLSSLLQNYHGHSDVCLSVPCVLGRGGIMRQLEIPLDAEERKKLAKSVKIIKNII